MAIALIGDASFTIADDGTVDGKLVYEGRVYFVLAQGAGFNVSMISVPLVAGDTLATLQAKFLTAIDTEAARLGIAAPTAVYGNSVAKFR